jgi:hypothetical protein
MSIAAASVVNPGSGFALKHQPVDLLGSQSRRTPMTLADLEGMRTHRSSIPASKHGLETICGASCETGAQ